MALQRHTAAGTSPHVLDARRPWQATRVPVDVQFCILDCTCEDPALHDLALTCRLVCQAWAARCAPLLFSRLRITTSRSLDDIAEWVVSEKGQRARDVVVKFMPKPGHTPANIVWGDRVFRLLRRYVPHITSLRYVTTSDETTPVHTFSPHSATPRMLCSLFAALSKLNRLSLCEYNFVDARSLLAVLHALPELRHFKGTSLTWRRAYTADPLSNTVDLRLRSLVLRRCTALAPLLFVWAMTNAIVTSEARFPGINAWEMNGLMHVIRLCDEMAWTGSARISLVENAHVETPWTLRVEEVTGRLALEVHIGFTDGATRAACSVRSVVLHRWPSDQTDSLIKQLEETTVQYLPSLMCLEKITIMKYATSVLERGSMGRTTSSWTPSPSVIFRRQGADHAGVFLSTILDPMAAGKGLLDNGNEPVIFRQGSRVKHEISVHGLDCNYDFEEYIPAVSLDVELPSLTRLKLGWYIARSVKEWMADSDGIWRISEDIVLRFEDVILTDLQNIYSGCWQSNLAFETTETIDLLRADLM